MKCKLSKLFFLTLMGAFSLKGYSQTAEERKKIVENYDLKSLKELGQRFKNEFDASYAKGLEVAKERNLPISGTTPDGSYFELKGYNSEIDQVIYYKTFNNLTENSSVQTARAQHLYNGGSLGINIQGQNMILGIWDGGHPQASHPNLGPIERVSNKDGDTSPTTAGQSGVDHATHVAGTMIGNGSSEITAKGIAFNGFLWSNTWTNDLDEMETEAGLGLLVSNHSYGTNNTAYINSPEVFGRYNGAAKDLDELLFLADKYQPVYAAGNDRQGVNYNGVLTELNPLKNGYDLMVNETVSKNAVVVAAIKGFTEYTSPLNVVMTDFSQWGPTDEFRVKPDISAKGFAVYSSNMPTATSSNSYGSYPGTSMAAPAVTSVFALWQQYHKQLWPSRNFMRSASLRALMAHTASQAYEVGDSTVPGPNAKYGWGVINAQGGAQVLKDAKANLAVFKEETLVSGQVYELDVQVDGTSPLTATIAWTDKEGMVVSGTDSTNSVLVNDLDLRVIRPNTAATVVFPYVLNKSNVERYALTADNDVDNIEKVYYAGAATGLASAGVYKIRVTHKGATLDSGSQKFTLIVSGGVVDSTASVENNIFDELKVYPNPATEVLNISANSSDIQGAKVSMYDMLGKLVYSNNALFQSAGDATIDVSNFQTGIYLVEILKGTKVETRKIVIK